MTRRGTHPTKNRSLAPLNTTIQMKDRRMGKSKRHHPGDRTATEALAELEGFVAEDQTSPFAEAQQRRQRIIEAETKARNERIRRARAARSGDEGVA